MRTFAPKAPHLKSALIIAVLAATTTAGPSLAQPANTMSDSGAAIDDLAAPGPKAQTFISCLAVTSDVILRSDIMPIGTAKTIDLERDWKAFIRSRAVEATRLKCEAPTKSGKLAAYSDVEVRIRRLESETGVHTARYTGWRAYSR